MRFIASSRASLLLVATAAALCLPSALAHITVEDNFVDDAVREDILAQLPEQTRFKHTLDLPGQLYQRILSVLHPSNTDLSLTETSVPTRGEGRFVSAHKDVFEDRSTVEGPVGLIYLEGDGRMLFQHEVTGEETVVDVRPGRLLSWDNSIYTHTLIPGDMPRRFLGPMAFRDGGMQSIGGPAPTPAPSPAPTPAPSPGVSVIAQAYTNTLSVSAGRIIRVTLNFMVLGMNPTRERTVRKLEDLDLVIGVRTERNKREGENGGREQGRVGGKTKIASLFDKHYHQSLLNDQASLFLTLLISFRVSCIFPSIYPAPLLFSLSPSRHTSL